ncbi:MAG: S1 family peptidase [Candidatus Methanoperedens sp.]|nr:S1 family peptidase [Candidatus Methanoperedens sp.]
MKKNKGMQLGAMLAVMLLVALAFAGTAAPNKEFKKFPKDLPERVLLGLNDSELQDKDIPDFGPEVFEKMKKDPKVIETRGIIPKYTTDTERRSWLDKLDKIRIGIRNDMLPYIHPNGTVISYGFDWEGFFYVDFYENATVNASLVDEIYAIIDKQAIKIGIQEVPVEFKVSGPPKLTLAGYQDYYRPVIGGVQVVNGASGGIGTLGFAAQDTNGNKGYVVANHFAPIVGTVVYQPDTSQSGYQAGTVSKVGTNTADAAFVPYNNVEASIHIGGGVRVPVKGFIDPFIGMQVFKSGRTTGVNGGTVTSFGEVYWNGYHLYDQAFATYYTEGGDSGAPVWYLDANSNRFIAGINAGIFGSSYFSKISNVKNSLSVNVLTR